MSISTELLPEKTQVKPERTWKVVIFNDDVTPFDIVIFAVQKVTGVSLEVAEMIAMETHTKGESVAKTGLSQEKAEVMSDAISELTRLEGICPGIACDAIQD